MLPYKNVSTFAFYANFYNIKLIYLDYPEAIIKYDFSVSTGIGQGRANEDRFIAIP